MKAVFSIGTSETAGDLTKGPFNSIYIQGYVVFGVGGSSYTERIATYTNGMFDVGNSIYYQKMSIQND